MFNNAAEAARDEEDLDIALMQAIHQLPGSQLTPEYLKTQKTHEQF